MPRAKKVSARGAYRIAVPGDAEMSTYYIDLYTKTIGKFCSGYCLNDLA